MTNTPNDPRPADLAKAFSDAVLAYESWKLSGTEQKIPVGHGFVSVTAVCGVVDTYSDKLPEHVFQKLDSFLHYQPHGELKAKLDADRSYVIGAQCLRYLVKREESGTTR